MRQSSPVQRMAICTRAIFTLLLSASHLGMLPPHGVVAPPGQAGGEALARRFGLDVMDGGVAITWCIPAAMSRRGIRAS
jgi:hypothetical protein